MLAAFEVYHNCVSKVKSQKQINICNEQRAKQLAADEK
jgi:hypothetical protein